MGTVSKKYAYMALYQGRAREFAK